MLRILVVKMGKCTVKMCNKQLISNPENYLHLNPVEVKIIEFMRAAWLVAIFVTNLNPVYFDGTEEL